MGDHHQKGMSRKWERYYRETRSTVGSALILFGITFTCSLSYLWPQIYNPAVFNSRMSYHLIMDIEDMWTCNTDYNNFVVDEPTAEEAMTQFYIFNVSNAPEVIQRGYKPYVTEVGPYAYLKKSYKYEVIFDHEDFTKLTFKEYTMLEPSSDPKSCTRMYYRMDRAETSSLDPCVGGVCECRDHEERLTIVNPLFLKMVWEETAPNILAYFSVDVYTVIKSLYENEFVNSTFNHLVSRALGEVYQFREQLQIYPLLVTMVHNISVETNYNYTAIGEMWTNNPDYEKECGLEEFEMGTSLVWQGARCPISSYDFINVDRTSLKEAATAAGYSVTDAEIPHAKYLFMDNTTEYSFLNYEEGLTGYLGLAWALYDTYATQYIDFNNPDGHTMFNMTEAANLLARRADLLATRAFGSGYTPDQGKGAEILIKNVAQYLAKIFNKVDSFGSANCPYRQMVYTEFANTSEPVICNVHGMLCVWQYGYMVENYGSEYILDQTAVHDFVSIERKLNTNPNNLAYLGNTVPWYNVWVYHNKVLGQNMTDACYDLEYSYNDALVTRPAGLYALQNEESSTNSTYLQFVYKQLTASEKENVFNAVTNISYLMFEAYPKLTAFHDYYVIRFINKYKEAEMTHHFTEGNWKEIGWAQWGGGFITELLTEVRTVYQVNRDGMWHWGAQDFWDGLMEYGAWCIKVGFPQAYIYDPYEARDVLIALADKSASGVAFRQHLVYTGTTFVGDGVAEHYINEVGDIGEYAFTAEANRGNFSCPDSLYNGACEVLNVFYTSSAQNAYAVDAIFEKCKVEYQTANPYIQDLSLCERFETSMTSPQQGIQVSETDVAGNPHPYTKSRGNVLYEMLFSLTTDLKIKSGLWCPNFDGCPYAWGGLFTSVKVRQVLFEGFTEPSVLRYLNMRYEEDSVSFSCVENSEGECGKEILRCNEAGVYLHLPGGQSKILSYSLNSKDEYFTPYIEIVAGTNEILYQYHMNESVVARYFEATSDSSLEILKIRNPFWAAYPAWHSTDVDFQKFHQCLKRTYFGMPNKFLSCRDMLNTGREEYQEARNQRQFYGNETLHFFSPRSTVDRITGETLHFTGEMHVNGSRYMQHPGNMWYGFQTYNYSYSGRTTGEMFGAYNIPRVFFKEHSISLELNQNMFIYEWQKTLLLAMPIDDDFDVRNFTREKSLPIRRFQEWEESWRALGELGRPFDSYGMEYVIPKDMASLEVLAEFPLYVGTPHAYGNALWGGTEFGHVQGYEADITLHRTFIDYDPITGRNLRQAIRQQVNVRIEKGPMYPNVFSSQDRCVAPTKAFSANTGYGCFAYVPLLWIDDSRVMSNHVFYRLHDHFYMRPGRTYLVQLLGLIVGTVITFVGLNIVIAEYFHRRNFHKRVYVD
jgi:hypothetical protein